MKPNSIGLLKILFSLVLVLATHPIEAQNTAQSSYAAGMIATQKKDWNGAISNFNKAIELNPQYDEAYSSRAYVKSRQGDYEGAIADYTQALNLNPLLYNAYGGRGFAKYKKGDTDGAIVDYDQAIKVCDQTIALNPRDPQMVQVDITRSETYVSKGEAQQDKGDLDEAIADYTKAIQGDSRQAMAYKMRGYAEYEKMYDPTAQQGYATEALRDFQKAMDLNPNDEDYPRLFIWLLKVQDSSQQADATRDLAEYFHLRPGKPDEWPVPVGLYLIDDISESDLLKAIESGDKRMALVRRCEGNFYIGMKHAYAGDEAGSLAFFQQAVDTKQIRCIECQVAQTRLNQAHNPATSN